MPSRDYWRKRRPDKSHVAAQQRAKFHQDEGGVFIGKARKKTPVFCTERRRDEKTAATYPGLVG
jgi:hypothetical protein